MSEANSTPPAPSGKPAKPPSGQQVEAATSAVDHNEQQ